MGGMSDYALEVAMQGSQERRSKPRKEKKNVPTAMRDAAVDAKIAECVGSGISLDEAVRLTVEWNAVQASPMKVGLVKQRVYVAYKAAGR